MKATERHAAASRSGSSGIRQKAAGYALLELAATLGAVAGALVADAAGAGGLSCAVTAAWGENVGFYALAIRRDMKRIPSVRGAGRARTAAAVRSVLAEFGPSEMLDSLLVRPATMAVFPWLLGGLAIGIAAGKIAADLIFYGIAYMTCRVRQQIPAERPAAGNTPSNSVKIIHHRSKRA